MAATAMIGSTPQSSSVIGLWNQAASHRSQVVASSSGVTTSPVAPSRNPPSRSKSRRPQIRLARQNPIQEQPKSTASFSDRRCRSSPSSHQRHLRPEIRPWRTDLGSSQDPGSNSGADRWPIVVSSIGGSLSIITTQIQHDDKACPNPASSIPEPIQGSVSISSAYASVHEDSEQADVTHDSQQQISENRLQSILQIRAIRNPAAACSLTSNKRMEAVASRANPSR
ncbi:hypothetical protein ACLOJK_019540 [Asimina triloba]